MFDINVSKSGSFIFKIESPDQNAAHSIVILLKEKFKAPYEVEVTRWQSYGRALDTEKFINKEANSDGYYGDVEEDL